MESRFEQQQPLNNSGFVHSDALEQHVGKRVKGGKPSRKSGRAQGDDSKSQMRTTAKD